MTGECSETPTALFAATNMIENIFLRLHLKLFNKDDQRNKCIHRQLDQLQKCNFSSAVSTSGLVGVESCARGCEFESQHKILVGKFGQIIDA